MANADSTKRARNVARADEIGAGGSDQIPDSDSQAGAQHEANDVGQIMALYTKQGRKSNLGTAQMSSRTILEQKSKNVSDQKIQDALRTMLDAARQQLLRRRQSKIWKPWFMSTRIFGESSWDAMVRLE